MHIREMHYDFKSKINKIDSQKTKNFLVPEIDWLLNEAQELFVKLIAEPRIKKPEGFEVGQRTIDDIKTLIRKQFFQNNQCIAATLVDSKTYSVLLPNDYMFYTSSRAIATKGQCINKPLVVHIRQDDDLFQESVFDIASFEWRETNGLFSNQSLLVYTDGTFNISHVCLNYIKKPVYIHNAQDSAGGQYYLPDNTTLLTGSVNCELPAHVHREIVDLAVLIASGNINTPDYALKLQKIKMVE